MTVDETSARDVAGAGGANRAKRSREDSRRRLVDAARAAFTERGIRDTPVELICERAGFTRGAFYSNFASKEELFLVVYEEEIGERMRMFAEALHAAGDPAAVADVAAVRRMVADIARRYVTTYTGDATWFLLVTEMRLQALRQPTLRPRVVAVLDRSVDNLAGVIEEFIGLTDLRLGVSVQDLVRAVLALYEDALARNLLLGRPLTADNTFLTEAIPRLIAGMLDWPDRDA